MSELKICCLRMLSKLARPTLARRSLMEFSWQSNYNVAVSKFTSSFSSSRAIFRPRKHASQELRLVWSDRYDDDRSRSRLQDPHDHLRSELPGKNSVKDSCI